MTSPPLPLVTIITSTYRHERYLKQTIDSVLSQDYPRVEYQVINDGSPDGTEGILRSYGDRIEWETQPNMGEVPTLNKALMRARGDLVGKLSSDDFLYPGAIRAVVDMFLRNPALVMVFPDFDLVDEEGTVLQTIHKPDLGIVDVVRHHLCLPGPGTLFRRELLDELGGFDTRYHIVFDMDFWWRCGLVGPFARVPITLAAVRQHSGSQSFAGGERMAAETASFVKRFFLQPNLPKTIRKVRREAMSNAFYAAGMQCSLSGDLKLPRLYLLKSLLYSPRNYLRAHNRIKLVNWIEVVLSPKAASFIRSVVSKTDLAR